MTPQDIVSALQGRGWEASVVSASEVNLVDVGPEGLLKCVDGRMSDHPGMNGPKALGGIYACLLYTSPSPRDATLSRMPSSA